MCVPVREIRSCSEELSVSASSAVEEEEQQ